MIGSVRRRHTFTEFRRRGLRVQQGAVRVTYLAPTGAGFNASGPSRSIPPPCDLDRVEVAYALGRRYGTAVERSRARRRLRDAFTTAWCRYRDTHVATGTRRLDRPQYPSGSAPVTGAFLLSGTRRVLTAPFTDLVDNMLGCLGELTPVPAGDSP